MSVKDKKRGRPSGKQAPLSAEHILATAKDLMQPQGKMPSIRQLASALDVDAMAIYHYFKNKQALQVAICVSLIEAIDQPDIQQDIACASVEQWQTQLHALCRSYLTLLTTYPGLLDTFLSLPDGGPANVFIARFEHIIAPLALSEAQAKDALHLLVDYLHGFAHAHYCNPEAEALSLDMMDGPFTLYCAGLAHLSEKGGATRPER
ncbi:TetR/AcrR family transcriptional regulator [Photobacterium japonica]|uniref:TetR/AcrR family transcriptional regulator n=1 Tax=Photobacterium japonica TaxID=2910235 RepID=UPI003D0B0B4F